MKVLLIRPRFLTVEECQSISAFASCCSYDADDSIEGDRLEAEERNNQSEIVKEWFDQWCGEASAEYDLHPDDDHDELWAKFCEVVAK